MARKFKTYITSIGFYDLAVAAPSMKAAIEAWGTASNVFQLGFAQETTDPDIVARTQAYPGTVLRRPVGSKGEFKETSALPDHLTANTPKQENAAKPRRSAPKRPSVPGRKDERAAAQAYDREEARRKREREKAEAIRARKRQRLEQAAEKIQSKLAKAKADHERKLTALEKAITELEAERDDETARWNKARRTLETQLRKSGA